MSAEQVDAQTLSAVQLAHHAWLAFSRTHRSPLVQSWLLSHSAPEHPGHGWPMLVIESVEASVGAPELPAPPPSPALPPAPPGPAVALPVSAPLHAQIPRESAATARAIAVRILFLRSVVGVIPVYGKTGRSATEDARGMPAHLQRTLARRIREVAAERGIPLTHLADRADVSRSHLWRVMDGDCSPTLALIERLAAALDVPSLALLTDDGSRSAPAGLHAAEEPASYAPNSTRKPAPRRRRK